MMDQKINVRCPKCDAPIQFNYAAAENGSTLIIWYSCQSCDHRGVFWIEQTAAPLVVTATEKRKEIET